MPVRTYPQLAAAQERLYRRRNKPDATWHNGLYERFADPILTREHIPVAWRYDADPASNPFAIERLGVGGVYNAGAIELDGRIALVARVEGVDRKSFFAVAESRNGIDGFRFRPEPVILPETDRPDVNVYDMRLTRHQDGWIYGLFCSERKDAKAAKGDLSSAEAQCGIARTRDLTTWERLPDLRTPSPQQRNVVLHPEFVNGKYLLYTRPQDGFIDAGSGGGIGWGLVDDMSEARIAREQVFEHRAYHTIKEVKNGQGPHPIRTPQGWLHVAHGVRGCAAGLRYVLYAFMTELEQPWKVIAAPGGHLIAPLGGERVGDVSNVVFSNGMVARADGTLLIYYASSDTRMHVARTTVAKMVDYCLNTPADGLRSAVCVQQRLDLIRRNQAVLGRKAKATPVAKAKARAAGARA